MDASESSHPFSCHKITNSLESQGSALRTTLSSRTSIRKHNEIVREFKEAYCLLSNNEQRMDQWGAQGYKKKWHHDSHLVRLKHQGRRVPRHRFHWEDLSCPKGWSSILAYVKYKIHSIIGISIQALHPTTSLEDMKDVSNLVGESYLRPKGNVALSG